MELNLFFNYLILIFIVLFVFFAIKSYAETLQTAKTAKQTYSRLLRDFVNEEKKHKINSQNIILLDELHSIMFKRLFKITRDILFIQKILLNNHLQ